MKDIIALGIHIGHDRCVAIVKNGLLIGSIAQERIDRVKHSSSPELPYQAIDSLLEYLSIDIRAISYIGITFSSVNIFELEHYFYEELNAHYQITNFTLVPVSHHLAHAEAVYDTSDFDKAIILVADGGGDCVNGQYEAESLFVGNGDTITLLEQRFQVPPVGTIEKKQNYIYPFMDKTVLDRQISVGRKYEQITYMLGFKWGECGKTMGLASYGHSLWDVPDMPIRGLQFDLRLKDMVQEIYARSLLSGKSYFEFLQDERANIAYTVQNISERLMLQCIREFVHRYDVRNICLAGGTFLNCMLNHKILEEIPGVRLHICPAAGDDGQAAGAAFIAYRRSGRPVTRTSAILPYLGLSYKNDDILKELQRTNLHFRYLDDGALIQELVKQINANRIVALLRGKSEFGPRALGHRSILCNPSWGEMKNYLNDRVKHREAFRPFAPMVTYEDAFTLFDLRQDSPHMLLACQVKDDYRDKIPAVVHVDGTARVQTVHKEREPFLYALLEAFKLVSGTSVLLNTSFNDNGQPIVESPRDAITTFLNTNIDVLVMENYIVEKSLNNTSVLMKN